MAPVAHTVLPLLVAALFAGAAVSGFEPTITPRLIDEAVGIGESRIDSVRTRFHQLYRLQVGRPPIDYIDLVTPYRRVVLLTEERTALGIRGYTQREATAALGSRSGVVELRVEMTFHPQNAFVGVPDYDVELVPSPPTSPPTRLMPGNVERTPRFGARVETAPQPAPAGATPNRPGGGSPLVGGTIVAAFPIARLNTAGAYEVVVSEKGKELGRARVNFAGLK
jgi:hypothetical protein